MHSLKRIIIAERPRFFLWTPVAMMIGIGWYFMLPNEPPDFIGAYALAVFICLLILARHDPMRWIFLPPLLIALGFSAAQYRIHYVETPLLTYELRNTLVEGTIDEIDPVEQKEKLVLSHLVIDGLPQAQTPLRVRISFREQNPSLQTGDRVRIRANLFPLPAPIMPGSYDFARHFYFRSIGGNGFAMRPAEITESGGQSSLQQWLNNLRHTIGEDMRNRIGGSVGTVAAAMTVGETGPIPADIKSVLRDSGLAHMLAIAGLHLGIVAGVIFFNVRLLLTLYPPLALRFPIKKIAALFALISAFIYLSLAGYPIPAERAFIMVAFLFTAIMIDRRGITLRTLAIAAILILLVFPESLFGASFQMSFAATLAIVALFERFGKSLQSTGISWWHSATRHGLGIVATSLVATLATSPFVLYHFNRFALFGLLANMVVVPLATFIIMPGMVLSLILMPLGLQWIGYAPMALGTHLMIGMAEWVTSLPSASLHLPSPTDAGLVIAALGLLCVCLVGQRIRWLGLAFIALGLATIWRHEPVDVLISDDAHQVMVRLDSGHYTTLRGTARSFTVQNWLRTEGEDELIPLKESGIACDTSSCFYQRHNHSLLFVKKPLDADAMQQACAQKSDVLVAWSYLHADQCPGPALLIGRDELATHGAYALWLDDKVVRVARVRETGHGQRIWQPVLTQEIEDDY